MKIKLRNLFCLQLVAISLLTIGVHASAASFEGNWTMSGKNSFSVELVQKGHLVCGQMTVIQGDKVDASWTIGGVDKRGALVDFSSGFSDRKTRGIALLNIDSRKLKLQVKQQIDQSLFWEQAVLTRRTF